MYSFLIVFRFDLWPFLYNASWSWQFRSIDEQVKKRDLFHSVQLKHLCNAFSLARESIVWSLGRKVNRWTKLPWPMTHMTRMKTFRWKSKEKVTHGVTAMGLVVTGCNLVTTPGLGPASSMNIGRCSKSISHVNSW